MAGDIEALLDDLSISKTNFLGYSMGAMMGFRCIARYSRSRFYSLILGGAGPYAPSTDLERQAAAQFRRAFEIGVENGMDAYITYEADGKAYAARDAGSSTSQRPSSTLLWNATLEWPSPDDILPTITIPCLIYAGEDDIYCSGAREGAKQMPNATFASFPGLDHQQTQNRGDLVIPLIRKFLAEIQ